MDLRNFALALICALLALGGAQSQCPSPKANRKAQERRLNQLQSHHVVALITPIMSSDGEAGRFVVRQVWERNHGGLQIDDEIQAAAGDEVPTSCVDALNPLESYIAILEASTAAPERSFVFVEPPVSGKRTKLRQRVWRQLCAGGYGGNCAMRVDMEREKTFFRDSFSILHCKVDLAWWRVESVEWRKDHMLINTEYHRMAGIQVNANDPADSFVMFKASHLHIGTYTCTVRDSDGNEAVGTTQLDVKGPFETSLYTGCRAKEAGKCMNGGTCRRLVQDFDGLIDTSLCMCKVGFEGPRCEEALTGVTLLETWKDGEGDKDSVSREVSNLTIAVTVLSVALVFSMATGAYCVCRLRRKQRRGFVGEQYDACKQEMTVVATSETRYTSPEDGGSVRNSPSTKSERSQRTVSLVSEAPPYTPRSRLSAHSS